METPRIRSLEWLLVVLLVLAQHVAVHVGALSVEPTIVTNLRVVQGASLDQVREQCAAQCPCRHFLTTHVTTNWFLVGTNLNTATPNATPELGSGAAFVYLCMRQDRRAPVERNQGLLFVLQSIAVLNDDNGGECPSSMQLLFKPNGVPPMAASKVVCVQFVPTQLALATGTYISDIDVVRASDIVLSRGSDGWTSVPIPSASQTTASGGEAIFIRYKRPVRPILGIQLLQNVGSRTSGATACRTTLDTTWEHAGTSHYLTDGQRSVLCIQRAFAPVDGDIPPDAVDLPTRVLTQVEIVERKSTTAQKCSSGFQEHIELGAKWIACLKYEDGAAFTQPFISHLLLSTRRTADTTPLPADLAVVSPSVPIRSSSNGDMVTQLLYQQGHAPSSNEKRKLVSQASQSTTSVATPLAQKPALQARIGPDTSTAANSRLTFKILQLADLHLTGDPDHFCRAPPLEHARCGMQCTESLTTAFVNDLLDAEKPDLVVFSGDTVTVPEWHLKDAAIHAALTPVESRKIPYAWIMGNHDDDYVFTRQEIMDILVKRELAYAESGPSTIQGVGNYELNIKAPTDGPWGPRGDDVFRIYFLDSNKNHDAALFPHISSRYDWIRKEQIEFYRNLSRSHLVSNQDQEHLTATLPAPLPAIMFFHIPIPEYGGLGSFLFPNGEKHEKTEGPDYNSGLLDTLVELDEVKATFVGHDHTNEYCYKRRGVQLCYGGGAGFGPVYVGAVARRARVIEWSVDSQNRRQIRSWKRHFGSTFTTRQRKEVLYSEF